MSIEGLVRSTNLFPIADSNNNSWNFEDLDLFVKEEKLKDIIEANKEFIQNIEAVDKQLKTLHEEGVVIKLANSYFENTPQDIFARCLEIIYLVRCSLMHGDLDINDENRHDLVKHCYIFLNTLMQNLI